MRWLEDVLLLEFITLRRVVVVAAFWFTLYQANPAWQLLLIGIAYLLPAAVIAWAQRRLKVDLTLDASFSPEPPISHSLSHSGAPASLPESKRGHLKAASGG